jgi:hypothetical protein
LVERIDFAPGFAGFALLLTHTYMHRRADAALLPARVRKDMADDR